MKLSPAFAAELTDILKTFAPYFARPDGTPIDLARRHVALWEWLCGLELGIAATAFVGIWPRGGGKSTSIELGLAHVARKRTRSYGLYVSETQSQADKHVQNVGRILENIGIERQVTKYGHSRAWRASRLIADGFALDAFGLDAAARGAKIDEARPDLIVLDDVDGEHDSPLVISKKVRTITHALLPAGATSVAVAAIQNLANRDGVFAQLADGRAQFLMDRIVSGPHKAIEGLEVEREEQDDGPTLWRIVNGTPTWKGQSREDCERLINSSGLAAFLAECQHETRGASGLFDPAWFKVVEEHPYDVRVARFWDLAATAPKPGKDPDYTCGVLLGMKDGQFWIIDVVRFRGTPLEVEQRVQQTAARDTRRVPIYIEQEGGSAGGFVIDAFQRRVLVGYSVTAVKPVRAKEVRAQPFASAAEAGNVFLVADQWNREFLDEAADAFGPDGHHDDQVDAVSGAHQVLTEGMGGEISRDDYRPVPGSARRFTWGDRQGEVDERRNVPPSKRRRRDGGRLGGGRW